MNRIEQQLKDLKKIKVSSIQEIKSQNACLINGYDTTTKQPCLLIMVQLANQPTDVISPEKLEKKHREVQVLKNCNNKNILQYLDSFQIENNYFIQLERPLKTLDDWIKDPKSKQIVQNKEEFMKICGQIVNGMSYLHRYNQFLMDLSPETIFISEDLEVKLLSSKFFLSDDKDTIYQKYIRSGRDQRYFFYSPEILNAALNIWEPNIKRKEKSDIWALGIVMLILLQKNEELSIKLHQEDLSNHEYTDIDASINRLLSEDILNQNPQKRQNIQQLLVYFNVLTPIKKLSSNYKSLEEGEISEKTQDEVVEQELQDIDLKTQESEAKSQDSQGKQQEKSKKTEKRRKKSSKKMEETESLEESSKQEEKEEEIIEAKPVKQESKELEIGEEEKQKEVEVTQAYLQQLMIRHLSKDQLAQEVLKLKQYLDKNPNDVEALKVIARLYQKRGMSDQEISNYKKLIELSPNDAETYYSLGRAYLSKNRYDDAIAQFNICFEKDNKNIESLIKIADYYLSLKQYDKAQDVLEKGYKTNNTHPLILYKLGVISKLKNKFEEALDFFDQSLKFDGTNKECQTDRIQTFKKIKDNEIAEYIKVLEIDDHNYKVLYKIGVAYKEKEMIAQAIDHFNKSLIIYPRQSHVCLALGDCYLLQNNLKQAVDKYKDSLDINPKCSATWNQLGQLYLKKKKTMKAVKAFMNAMNYSHHKSPENQIMICELIKKQMDNCRQKLIALTSSIEYQNKMEVVYSYQFSVELDINYLKTQLQQQYTQSLLGMQSFEKFYHTLGLIYLAYRKPKKAILQLKKSLILNQFNQECLLDLASAYGVSKKQNECIYYSHQALFNYSKYNKNYLNLKEKRVSKQLKQSRVILEEVKLIELTAQQKSKVLYNIGHSKEKEILDSLTYFSRSLKCDINNTESWSRVGVQYLALKQYENAIESFQNCVKRNIYHTQSYVELSKIYAIQKIDNHHKLYLKLSLESKAYSKSLYYLNNKNYDKAVKNLIKWEDLNPISIDCQYYLSEAMRLIGKVDSQIHYLRKCLELNPTHEQSLSRISELKNSENGDLITKQILKEENLDQLGKLISHIEWEYIESKQNELSEMLQVRSESNNSFKSALYMKQKLDLNKAIVYFNEYIDQESKDFLGYYLLGSIYEIKNQLELAAQSYEQSYQLLPEVNFNCSQKLGLVYLKLKQFNNAIHFLLIANKIRENNEKTILGISLSYYQLKQYDESLKYFQICKQIAPANAFSDFYILLLNSRKQNINDSFPLLKQKAVEILEQNKGKNISEDIQQFLDCIIYEKDHKECKGFCQYQVAKQSIIHKKIEEAVEYLKKSTKANPDYYPFKIFLAQNLIIIKKIDKAVEELEKVLLDDEENFEANFLIGQCYFEKDNYKLAIQHLLVCKQQQPTSFDTLKLLGNSYKENKQIDLAIEYYLVCKEQRPLNPEVISSLARCYYIDGKIQLAQEQYKRSVEINPKNPDNHYQFALILMELKEYDQAVFTLQECIKLDGHHINAQNLMGEAYIQLNQINKAIAAFKKQGQVNKLNKSYMLNLGRAYILKDNISEAITCCSKYMNSNPDVEETYELLSNLFQKQKQPKKQVKILESLLNKYPTKKEINLRIADILWREKIYAEAIDRYEMYLIHFGDDKDIHYKIMMCCVYSRQYLDGVNAINRCLKLYPEMIECHFHLASIYFNQKEYQKAFNEIQITLKHNPDHIMGLYIKARILFFENKHQEALEILERCVITYDQLPELYYYLAKCYKKLKMKDYATACFNALLVKNPNHIECQLQIAYSKIKSNDYQAGINLIKGLQIIDNPKFYYYLAEAYYNTNLFEQAQQLYQKCFECDFNKYSKRSLQKVYSSLKKQRKFKEIKTTLEKYLKQNPKDAELNYYLAEVFIVEGIDYKQAQAYIDICLELKPDFKECKVLQSYFYLKVEKDYKKVIQFITEFFEESFIEKNIQAMLALSESHFELGELKQSREYIKQILNIDKNNEDAIYLQGIYLIKNNEIDQAILEFKKNINHDKSYYQIGILKKKQKKYDEARQSFNKAISIYPYDPIYYKALAKLEYTQKDYTKASQQFINYINLVVKPEEEIQNLLAQCYFNLKAYNDAIYYLNSSLLVMPDTNSYQLLGLCYLQKNDLTQAEDSFNKSISLNNQNSESYFQLGNCLRLQNKVEEAKKSYLSCVEIKKDHALCLNYLGEIYYKEKDFKKAKKYLVESTIYDTQNPNSQINLGKYFQKIENNNELAEAQYRKSIETDKNNKRGAKKLAKIYINLNKFDEADKTISTYQSLFENDPLILLFFGNYYFSKHRHDNAMSLFEKVLKKLENNVECQIKIASSLFMTKKFTQCEETLKKYSKNLEKTYEYYYLTVQLLLQKELDSKVVTFIKKCRDLQSNNENSHFLQSYFLHTKNSKNMKEYFDLGYKINPNTNELGLILKGIIHIQENQDEQAIKSFKQCLQIYPKSEFCLLTLGNFYIIRNKYEEAKDAFQKCLSYEMHTLFSIYSKPLTQKEAFNCKYGLALAYKGLNDVNKSLDFISQCLSLNSNDPQTIQLHAKILQGKGNISQAILNFQKYLQLNPMSDEILYLLGKARLDSGCPDQAIFSLRKCLSINPQYPNINSTLGEAYELDQQPKEALMCYQKQIELEPKNAKMHFKIALILIALESFNQAKEVIKKLILLSPEDYLVYSAEGLLFKRQGNYQQAIESFTQSLSIELNSYTQFNLALCYGEIGNVQKEKEIYKNIQKQNPHDKKTLNNLGNIYRQSGKYDKAISLFNQCIKLDQYFCEYHTNLGLCYHGKGEYEQAINCFQRGYTVDRINVECLLNMAASYKAKGEPQSAIKYYQKIIKLNSNYTAAYYNLAILQKQLGNITEAIANFKLCSEKDPNHINSIVQLAICYREQNDYNNSKQLLKKALELNQNHELANFNIALLYRQKFKVTKELGALQKALSQSPTNAKYLHNIGICHRLAENLQEALIYLKQSISFDSTNPTYHYNLADVYHSLRLYDEEIKCYKKCVSLHSNFEKAYHNMGVSYLYQKKSQEAIESFQKCLEINPNNQSCLFNLGNVFSQLNDIEKSNEYYNKCLELNENHLDSLNNLAVNCTKLKQYTQAISIYEKCLNISPTDEYRKKVNAIYGLLGKQS